MLRVLWKLFRFYRPFHRPLLVSFGLIMVWQMLAATNPYFMGLIVDGMFTGRDWSYLLLLACASAGILVGERVIVSTIVGIYDIRQIEFKLIGHTVRRIMEWVFSLSIGQLTADNSDRLHSVIRRGESAMIGLTKVVINNIFPQMTMLIIVMAALAYRSPAMAAIVLVGICLDFWLVYRSNERMRPDMRRHDKMFNDDDKLEYEFIGQAPMVMINTQEQRVRRESADSWFKVQAFGEDLWTRYQISRSWHTAILVATETAAVVVGLYYFKTGRMTPGEVVTCWAWARSSVYTINSLGNMQREFMSRLVSAARLTEHLDMVSDVPLPANPIATPIRGEIEFRNVHFAYQPRQIESQLPSWMAAAEDDSAGDEAELKSPQASVLRGVSFRIEPGQRVAIVGSSGSGKSTIINALVRAGDPCQGQILVDGHDLRDWDYRHFRKSIGIVPQQVGMFDRSLRYNLTFGLNGRQDEVTDRELDEVCRMARVDEFVSRLEHGYDTLIGQRGKRLSGGENQRAGIARALLKNPAILVFDEATSNLDGENEALIKDAITQSSRGRTTIIIAHRLSTIRDADKIFVLDDGQIVGEGRHEELVETNPVYQRFIRRQLEAAASLS